jgi:hypothetical protein
MDPAIQFLIASNGYIIIISIYHSRDIIGEYYESYNIRLFHSIMKENHRLLWAVILSAMFYHCHPATIIICYHYLYYCKLHTAT